MLVAALRGLTTPGRQVLEALLALGERRTGAALVSLLAGPPGHEHGQSVDAVLAQLRGTALAWPGDGDRIEVSPGLTAVLPEPLGLGSPARQVWSEQSVTAVEQALRALGCRPRGNKAEKVETLVALLADFPRVREGAASAPPPVAESLRRLAWAGVDEDDDLFDRYGVDGYRRRRDAEQWAIAHGLLAGSTWGVPASMPAEVALALRGADYRAPFPRRLRGSSGSSGPWPPTCRSASWLCCRPRWRKAAGWPSPTARPAGRSPSA